MFIIIVFRLDSDEQGRVDGFSSFDFLSLICFLLNGFHCTFSISYKILPYYVYYFHILLGCDRLSGLLFLMPASLLTFFVRFFILFHSCCTHEQVIGKTLFHEFPISYSHTEWYLLFLAL